MHLERGLLAGDDFLSRCRCTHLLLLFQELEPGQVLVQLPQSLVLLSFLFDPHLIPLFNDSILGLVVVHESVANLTLLRVFLEQAHRMSDLPSLVLCEQENLVGAFDENLLLGPQPRDSSDFFEDFVVFEAQDDYLVFQNCELKNAVEPRA